MPTYSYFCEANGETVQVFHSILGRIHTWSELCQQAGRDAGSTPSETPVERVIGGGYLHLRAIPGRGHSAGGCCGVDGCG